MITAIRELGTVLGGIKNGEKVKAGVEISDEEDWTLCVNSYFGKHKADSDILLWNIFCHFVLFLYLNSRLYVVQTVTNDEPEGWSFNFWRSRNCVNKLKFRMRKTEHVHEQIYIYSLYVNTRTISLFAFVVAVLVLSFKTSKLNQTVFNQGPLKSTSINLQERPRNVFTSMRYYVSGIDHYFIISHLPSHEKKTTYLQ